MTKNPIVKDNSMNSAIAREFPILEYDSDPLAIINPSIVKPLDTMPEHAVACFFQDVIDQLLVAGRLTLLTTQRSEIGEHPVYELEFNGRRLAVFHPLVGAPIAVGMMEEVIARGARKFVACGGAGVLRRDITVGHLVVPSSAIRDEGTSYHYLPPAREVAADPQVIEAIERILRRNTVEYILGKTWTTDAFYRETPAKVALRRSEGCVTVEMETAAFLAVAQFRGVRFGQILYGGDDVSGAGEWDHRDWVQQISTREKIFWLAVEACLEL
jgi:uridine phosphorylase